MPWLSMKIAKGSAATDWLWAQDLVSDESGLTEKDQNSY